MRDSVKKELTGYISESMRTEPVKKAVLAYLKQIGAYQKNEEAEVKSLIDDSLEACKEMLEECYD